MRLALATIVLCALSSLATAGPISAGVGLGRVQSKIDANGDGNDTKQIFGRLGMTPRLSAQLELARIEGDGANIRSGTALLVVDLGSKGRLVPILLAGAGLARSSDGYGYEVSGKHTEGGFGLEYRAAGGLTIGADVRLGGRWIEGDKLVPLRAGTIAYYSPATLEAGEYRSAQITAAIRF
jgi:hypothetical protein